MPDSAPAAVGSRASMRHAAPIYLRLRRIINNARRVTLVGADTYHLTVAAVIGKPCLARRDFGPERKAADAALEVIGHAEAAVAVGAWRPERLPAATVMHQQIHDCALLGDRSRDLAAERDRAFWSRPVRAHAEFHASADRLLHLGLSSVAPLT